jgi:phosphoribosylglycinamide formyltransferase 1
VTSGGSPEERRIASSRLAVLISGRGSNLQSIMNATRDGRLDATISLVIANRSDAAGLVRARESGIETRWINPRDYPDRQAFDRAVVSELQARQIDLVCLAGFMRVVTKPMLDAFPLGILNIHPSLLPAFPGMDAQRQALEYGVRISGATVHLVTDDLDAGPIVLQSAVPVLDDDTVETLSARILIEEHRIYPEAIRTVLEGGWSLSGRRFIRY